LADNDADVMFNKRLVNVTAVWTQLVTSRHLGREHDIKGDRR